MLHNEFLLKLESAPPIDTAVSGLFARAEKASRPRFFLCILDLHASIHKGKTELLLPSSGFHLAVWQFSEFLDQIAFIDPSNLDEEIDPNLIRRFHMLAYSQFWEHVAIQRLLLQLVRICNNLEYDPDLLTTNLKRTDRPCANVYGEIIGKGKKAELEIANVVETIYSNQIRNAFAHSQFFFIADLVSFENYDPRKAENVPSLKLSTWDKLFRCSLQFMSHLFRCRLDALEELRGCLPFLFELPEFERRFKVIVDERGHYVFVQ